MRARDDALSGALPAAAAPFVAGPATRHVAVTLAPGTLLVGVRLRPGWAQSCLGIPASELLDRDVPLDEVWGGAARGLERARITLFMAEPFKPEGELAD